VPFGTSALEEAAVVTVEEETSQEKKTNHRKECETDHRRCKSTAFRRNDQEYTVRLFETSRLKEEAT
jgi:hypothetical protein